MSGATPFLIALRNFLGLAWLNVRCSSCARCVAADLVPPGAAARWIAATLSASVERRIELRGCDFGGVYARRICVCGIRGVSDAAEVFFFGGRGADFGFDFGRVGVVRAMPRWRRVARMQVRFARARFASGVVRRMYMSCFSDQWAIAA